MINLFNLDINNIRYGGSDVKLIKLGGNIVYKISTLYTPEDFTNNTEITKVETIVNETHTNLSRMFYGCTNLVSVNTEDWNTSNVTDMRWMFQNCESLTSLDVSNWDTNKVFAMSSMFANCRKLTSLDLSNFRTAGVFNMNGMFSNCTNLQILNLSNFDTSNCSEITEIFMNCDSLKELRLDNCSYDTIDSLINSTYFPKNTIGKTRKIYCKEENTESSSGTYLTEPSNWKFSFI